MSFILDALKKSEHDRQRHASPGLVEAGALRPRPRLPVWAIALCLLLAVNLLVLGVVLMRGWITPQTRVPGAQSSADVEASDAAVGAPHRGSGVGDRPFSPFDPAPVYAPEIPVSPAAAPPAAPRPPGAGENSNPRPLKHRDPVLNEGDFKASDDEVLPSINELNLTGSQALPELHLDVHVFATKSNERFVFINMRKYHEGARLQEGPTVERIRRDGVILDYSGLRFLLPRQ